MLSNVLHLASGWRALVALFVLKMGDRRAWSGGRAQARAAQAVKQGMQYCACARGGLLPGTRFSRSVAWLSGPLSQSLRASAAGGTCGSKVRLAGVLLPSFVTTGLGGTTTIFCGATGLMAMAAPAGFLVAPAASFCFSSALSAW